MDERNNIRPTSMHNNEELSMLQEVYECLFDEDEENAIGVFREVREYFLEQ